VDLYSLPTSCCCARLCLRYLNRVVVRGYVGADTSAHQRLALRIGGQINHSLGMLRNDICEVIFVAMTGIT